MALALAVLRDTFEQQSLHSQGRGPTAGPPSGPWGGPSGRSASASVAAVAAEAGVEGAPETGAEEEAAKVAEAVVGEAYGLATQAFVQPDAPARAASSVPQSALPCLAAPSAGSAPRKVASESALAGNDGASALAPERGDRGSAGTSATARSNTAGGETDADVEDPSASSSVPDGGAEPSGGVPPVFEPTDAGRTPTSTVGLQAPLRTLEPPRPNRAVSAAEGSSPRSRPPLPRSRPGQGLSQPVAQLLPASASDEAASPSAGPSDSSHAARGAVTPELATLVGSTVGDFLFGSPAGEPAARRVVSNELAGAADAAAETTGGGDDHRAPSPELAPAADRTPGRGEDGALVAAAPAACLDESPGALSAGQTSDTWPGDSACAEAPCEALAGEAATTVAAAVCADFLPPLQDIAAAADSHAVVPSAEAKAIDPSAEIVMEAGSGDWRTVELTEAVFGEDEDIVVRGLKESIAACREQLAADRAAWAAAAFGASLPFHVGGQL